MPCLSYGNEYRRSDNPIEEVEVRGRRFSGEGGGTNLTGGFGGGNNGSGRGFGGGGHGGGNSGSKSNTKKEPKPDPDLEPDPEPVQCSVVKVIHARCIKNSTEILADMTNSCSKFMAIDKVALHTQCLANTRARHEDRKASCDLFTAEASVKCK